VQEHVDGVLAGDRTVLGRTFSLMESSNAAHHAKAAEVLDLLAPRSGGACRVGVSGVPGAGKSTFIEAFGLMCIEQGHRVAVLTIDPSSERTGGSILGDKTRMENLSRHESAFVRPTACGTAHGGVARGTRESILVCEAAGYDIVLVETVGVGQSETLAASMVDFFLLLLIAGAGDELQGMKRGILEVADAVAVNKADGDNARRAAMARAQLEGAMRFLQPSAPDWTPPVVTCSALTGEGLPHVLHLMRAFRELMGKNGEWEGRRRRQSLRWLRQAIEQELLARMRHAPGLDDAMASAEELVAGGQRSPFRAAEELVDRVWPSAPAALETNNSQERIRA
jgi:LAO/AO transport system kinase